MPATHTLGWGLGWEVLVRVGVGREVVEMEIKAVADSGAGQAVVGWVEGDSGKATVAGVVETGWCERPLRQDRGVQRCE